MKADTATLTESADTAPETCCGTTACRTPDEPAAGPAKTPAEAKAAAGCACGG